MSALSTRSRAFIGATGVIAGIAGTLIVTTVVDDNDTQSTQSFAQIPADCPNQLSLEVPDKGTIYWCDLPTTTEVSSSTTLVTTQPATTSTSSTLASTTSVAETTTTSSTSTSTTSSSTTTSTLPSTTSTSTTVSPPSTTTPPPNGLDSLLRPPPGKLLNGVEWEGGGFTGWVSEAGEIPHIFHRYSTSGATFVTALNSVPEDMIPLINFKPLGGAMSLSVYNSILAGNGNSNIDTAADAVIAYGKPMFVVIMHEPEDDGTGTAYDSAYAAAWRYTAERMQARGATNAVFVWNMMGIPNHGTRYDGLYPGDDVVDWIGADLYIKTSTVVDTWAELANNNIGFSSYGGFYNWAAPKGKPMIWAEWGIGQAVVPTTPTKMFGNTEMANLVNDLPLIKALVYWNEAGTSEYRVTSPNWPNNMIATWVDRPEFQVDISAVAK